MSEFKQNPKSNIQKGVVSCRYAGHRLGPLRIGGQGLANQIWMWCKQVVFSHETGNVKVWPVWNQVKPKSILRGEWKMAYYMGYFRKPDSGYCEFGKTRGLETKYLPGELPDTFVKYLEQAEPAHWVVRELGNPFCSMFSRRALLREEWNRIQKHPAKKIEKKPYAVIHLRRGDFRLAGLASDLEETSLFIERFMSESRGMRRMLMTDADSRDEAFWKRIPSDLKTCRSGNALEDLHVMIESDVLFGTAESSYSRCAAFFGGMKTDWLGDVKTAQMLKGLQFNEGERK